MPTAQRRISLVAIVLLACGATTARGQDLVISTRSTEGLISGFRAVLKAANCQDDRAQVALAYLEQINEPGRLKGIDLGKPMGACFHLAPLGFEPDYVVALIPVTDHGNFLATIQWFGCEVVPVADRPGISHQINLPASGPSLFGRFEDGYAIFSTAPDGPPDHSWLKPASILTTSAMLSESIRFDQIPAPNKDQIQRDMDEWLDSHKARKPGESATMFKLRSSFLSAENALCKILLRDGRDLALNVDADPRTGDLSLELATRFMPGTAMASSVEWFGAFPGVDAFEKPAAVAGMSPPVGFAVNVGSLALLASEVAKKGQARIHQGFRPGDVDIAREGHKRTITGGDALTIRLKVDGPVLKFFDDLVRDVKAEQP